MKGVAIYIGLIYSGYNVYYGDIKAIISNPILIYIRVASAINTIKKSASFSGAPLFHRLAC